MSLRVVSLRTSLSVVMACVAFTLVFLGVCRPPVSHFWRESLSLVSWCLSYFALHFVFIACVAYKLFSWRVSPRLQVVFMACVAFRLFSRRLSPLGCFYGVCRLPVSRFWRVSLSLVSWCLSTLHFVFIACIAYKLFSWRVSPSGCFLGVCRL